PKVVVRNCLLLVHQCTLMAITNSSPDIGGTLLDDYLMFSVDDHIDMQYLPKNIWTERLPPHLRDRAPHIEETDTGYMWVCEGKSWGQWAGGKPKGPPPQRYFKTALEKG